MRKEISELQKELELISKDISNHWNNNPLGRLIDVISELYEWHEDFVGEIQTKKSVQKCNYELRKK